MIDGEYLVDRIREHCKKREQTLLKRRTNFKFNSLRYNQLTSNLAELEHFRNEFKYMIKIKK